MEEKTLYPSRVKSLLLLLVTALFTVLGIWIIIADGSWKGWLCAIFFGLGTVVAVINLLPGNSYLRLTAEGFETSSLSRKYFYQWSDIEQFGVTYVGLNKIVVFNFSPAFDKAKAGRNISKQIAGWEGGLHDTFGMKAEKLAELMNKYLSESKVRAIEANRK